MLQQTITNSFDDIRGLQWRLVLAVRVTFSKFEHEH